MNKKSFLFLFFSASIAFSGYGQAPSMGASSSVKSTKALSLLDEMFIEHEKLTDLRYYMVRTERFNGELTSVEASMKFQRSPYRMYSYQEKPKAGLEVLMVEGSNNDKALINTNGFPWVNVSLDPMGNQMRKSSHHTALNGGFEKFIQILSKQFKMNSEVLDARIVYEGSFVWNNRKTHKIIINNPDFKFIQYTVKGEEQIDDIANRDDIAGYMIIERNEEVNDFYDLSPGMVITAPTAYAPKIELYIDAETKLPFRISIFDEKGLYERYEYRDVQINSNIPAAEFSQDYSKYGF